MILMRWLDQVSNHKISTRSFLFSNFLIMGPRDSKRTLIWLYLFVCFIVFIPCFLMPHANLVSAAEYQSADLPPVLEFFNGEPVDDPKDWESRRQEIKRLWCDTYIGHFPNKNPSLIKAQIRRHETREDGVQTKNVQLTFDTPNHASFEIKILLPESETKESATRFPLLLTQPRHYQIAWGEAAVRRGYVVCYYPGVDYNHREENFPGYEKVWQVFQKEYPTATWSSSLAIQSWLASRALDYLLSEQSGLSIDPGQVGIIGHSRYGKQSLYAAAFDDRFTAVVSRSAGSPAAAGYRFTGRETFMETVMDAPSEWALPSLKGYFGREHELPVESSALLALIAPRYCLLHTAYNDGSDPTFAVERNYLEAQKAYQFMGVHENIALLYRSGNHNPITEEHIQINLDWFDYAFKRGDVNRSAFGERLLHSFDWNEWKARLSPSDLVTPPVSSPLKEKIEWLSGSAPQEFLDDRSVKLTFVKDEDRGVATWSRDRWKPENVRRLPVVFGHNIQGNLAYPSQVNEPLPVVIWLHPFNYSHGSNEGYGVEGTTIYYRLAQAGYAVLSFDQCGFGDRLLEGASFYDDFPDWSKFGRMLHDVRSAVDFFENGKGLAKGDMPPIDRDHIVLLGYSLGGMVALHAGAMDDRVTAVASFCGFTPFRTDTDKKPTGGIRRWWEWHGLLPKLGLFHQMEQKIPYDFDELLNDMNSKSVLIYSAIRDRHSDAAEVESCVKKATGEKLTFVQSDDVNRFQSDQHQVLLKWLRTIR